MFSYKSKALELDGLKATVEALNYSQAVIEFNLDGTIITANDNFLSALGYTLDEIKGQHHRMFVDPAYRTAPSTASSGRSCNRGEFQAAEYKRIGKGGKEVWIQASYNPILDSNGKPFKVVKFATDVTAAEDADARTTRARSTAIGKSQAVIEFNLDGTIITANENFLSALGYSPRRDQGPASQHVRASRPIATAPSTGSSGTSSIAASIRPANTSASARAARKSGSRPPTTRSST